MPCDKEGCAHPGWLVHVAGPTTARAERVAAALVDEGFARWSGSVEPILRLR